MKLPRLQYHKFTLDNLPPKEASGVYVIREGKRVVYVGESHTGRLRKTFLRHFQTWSGKTAGVTYPRSGDFTVAWQVLPSENAYDAQIDLIEKLRPRDNTTAAPEPTWKEALADVIDAFDPF